MRNKKGFTLMELLTVIAVMAVLAGLLLPALKRARMRARVAAAESMIASMQVALSMYNMDYGVFPASSDVDTTQYNGNSFENDVLVGVGNNLVGALTSPAKGGPYMEFRGRDLDELGGDFVVLDPWGRAYVYAARTFMVGNTLMTVTVGGPFHPHDPEDNTYNIYSLGPDGVTFNDLTATRGNDWNDSGLVGNEECGHWNDSAVDSDDSRYDDINSWDGARR